MTGALGGFGQVFEQLPAEAVPSRRARDVDRRLRDPAVTGPMAVGAQLRPPGDLAGPVRADEERGAGDRSGRVLRGPRLGVECRDPVLDALVVDRGDRRGVLGRRRPDVHADPPVTGSPISTHPLMPPARL